MLNFVRRHERDIHGVLAGFDRIRFRGTQWSVSFADGLFRYLNFLHFLLTAFRAFVGGTTRKLMVATETLARSTPVGKVVYLAGNRDKQASGTGSCGQPTVEERRHQSGRVTRLLQLLQGHGLIRKVPKTHRYKITATGRNLATAVSAAQNASLKTLSQAA